MDRVFSARLDESVIHLIDMLVSKLHVTKKRLLEEAVRSYAEEQEYRRCHVFRETSGAWNRKETPAETAAQAKAAFRKSMTRYVQ